ncbi:MAG: T9SS type A sorting domain-containing protein [Lewinellaceae bacterium]|nr:T9SS type A sorting domain-containing protein [Lewinellaceae bacterium]
MKYVYSLLLLFGINNVVLAQNNTLRIDVKDVCQNLSSIFIRTDLYVLNGHDTTLLQSTASNPSEFTNLYPGLTYFVKVVIPETGTKKYGLKDAAIMMSKLFSGVSSKEMIIAGDFNNSGSLTALDFAEFMRDISGENIITPNYYLVQKSIQANISQIDEFGTFFIIDGITTNIQTLELTQVQKGHISDADVDQCNLNCILNSETALFFYDKYVKSQEKIIVPIFSMKKDSIYGYDVRFKYSNATLDTIITSATGFYTHDKVEKSAHFVWLENEIIQDPDSSSTIKKICTLEFTSNRNGKISELFSLDTINNNSVIKTDSCFIAVPHVALQKEDQFQKCLISWPPDIIIPDCTGNHLTGRPVIDESCNTLYFTSYKDIEPSPCRKIIRNWTGVNYVDLSTEHYFQVIRIDSTFNHICRNHAIIDFPTSTINIHARSLVEGPIDTHLYSFTNEVKDSTALIEYSTVSEERYIYDLTDSIFCIANIVKNKVVDTTNLNINRHLQIPYTDKYSVYAKSFFIGTIPSDINKQSITISQDGIVYNTLLTFDQSYQGKTKTLYLRFIKGGILFNYGEVYVTFEPVTLYPPLKLFAYDDFIIQDEPFTFDVYSNNFLNVSAFQFGFRLVNCYMTELIKTNIKPIYVYDTQWNFLKMLWYDENGQSITIDSTESLFKVTIVPSKSGNLSEFISLDPSVLYPSAYYGNNTSQDSVLLEFNFPQRPIINQTYNISSTFSVYPNPSLTGSFYLNLPKNEVLSRIELLSSTGELVPILWKENTDDQYEINTEYQIPSGLYILNVTTNKSISNQKVLVIK